MVFRLVFTAGWPQRVEQVCPHLLSRDGTDYGARTLAALLVSGLLVYEWSSIAEKVVPVSKVEVVRTMTGAMYCALRDTVELRQTTDSQRRTKP
jgi:hypothetical protein